MKDIKIIYNIGELVTLRGGVRRGRSMKDLGIIRNAAVVFSERIIEVGPSENILREYSWADEKIDANGKVLMPGFVDPHTHAVFAGTREHELQMRIEGKSYLEILKEGGGILYTVEKTRESSEETLYLESLQRLDTMLIHGTTTAEIKSGYGLDPLNEIKILKVIEKIRNSHEVDVVSTFMGAHAIPREKNSREFIEEMIKIIPEAAKISKFIDVFCERGVFSVEESKEYLMTGIKYGLIPKIHADEFDCIGCSELALEIGAISVDHLVKTSEEVIIKLSRSDIACVFLPGTPFVLMSNEYPKARKFIDAGAIVCLGTDLNPNCYTENMQMIITLAMLNMKMSIEEAISAATINSAYAIGMEKEVGSIEKGKKADMILINAKSYKMLGYHYGVNIVDAVIKRGRVVVSNGRLLTKSI